MDTTDQKPWIETPLIWSKSLSACAGWYGKTLKASAPSCCLRTNEDESTSNVWLKLENTQPSGSFKSRGVGNFLLTNLSESNKTSSAINNGAPHNNNDNNDDTAPPKTHFFCSSGGNAGLACVHAAATLGCPATIVVPLSTTPHMIEKLRAAGAEDVVQIGDSWYEADEHLRGELLPRAKSQGRKAVYVPPFDAQGIWDGNATLVDEIVRQLPIAQRRYPVTSVEGKLNGDPNGSVLPDAVVCSVGGGGLFSGIMQGLDSHGAKGTRVVAVETFGADSLAQSIAKGQLVTLPGITSIATSLGARTVCRKAFEYAMDQDRVVSAVLQDSEAVAACRRFANEERTLVETSCAVSLAVLYEGKLRELLPDLKPASNVVVVVCGGSNISLEIMSKYIEQFLGPSADHK